MAWSFNVNGLERFQMDVAAWASIPKDLLLEEVVLPAADFLKEKMSEAAGRFFNVVSGSLSDSIKILRKGVYESGASATVGPSQGKHPKSTQGVRRPRAQGGGGGLYQGTNAEVAYILEYGSSRIPARHWMELTCSKHEAEIQTIMEDAFFNLLELLRAA